jgi:hypothetical protein
MHAQHMLARAALTPALCAAAALLCGCATDFGQQVADGVNKNLTARGLLGGPKAVDAAGLRNILPQFDPNKSIAEQYPHVAVTVLKSPALWADLARDSTSKQYHTGCFTLRAVVWSDAKSPKTVGPFEWCSPRDLEVQPGMGGYTEANFNAIVRPIDIAHMTGIARTDGPRPPGTLAPADRETTELQVANSSRGSTSDLSRDNVSKFGLMFWNLRHAMGATLRDQDFRVWIVKIERATG